MNNGICGTVDYFIVPQVLFKWVETARVLRSGRESYAVVRINTGEDLKWNR